MNELRKVKVGDTVMIVNNESGGFENGQIVKVVETHQYPGCQNLVLTDGNFEFKHVDDEVVFIK